MINFPHSYYDDEKKCDFYIPSMVKRTWAVGLQILNDIDKVCRRHNIEYFAEWGTLLGTIRHGGYIPWDDDLDICMKRPDYEKFLSIARDELPEGYDIVNYKTSDSFRQMLSRVVNTDHYRFDQDFLTKFSGLPFGFGIDIFPMDFLTDDEEYEKKRFDKIYLIQSTLDIFESKGANIEVSKGLAIINANCNSHLSIGDNLSIKLRELMEQIQGQVSEKEASYITLYSIWFSNHNYKYPKEYYEHSVRMPFEIIDIPVPLYYNEILSKKYTSAYMTPVRKGGAHNYPCFQVHLDVLKEHFNYEWPSYSFSSSDLSIKNLQRNPDFSSLLLSYTQEMKKSHELICDMISSLNTTDTAEVLGQCQSLAITLGTLIELRYRVGTKSVQLLEQYCEALYELSQYIHDLSTEVIDRIASLNTLIDDFTRQYNDELASIKVHLFICPDAKYLSCMTSLIDYYQTLDNTLVKIMPIPCIEVSPDMSGSTVKFDIDSYPSCYEYVDYESFDFATHPDEIVVSYPYDEFNLINTTEKHYHSKSLIRETDKLTFVPFFDLESLDKSDERSVINLKYCLLTPLTAVCDQILVNSINAVEIYREILTKEWGQGHQNEWDKIQLISSLITSSEGSESTGRELISRGLTIDNSKAKEDRKILLYYVGINSFMANREKMLDKFVRSFETFKEKEDSINIVFMEQFCLTDALKKFDNNLFKEYIRLRDELTGTGQVTCGDPSLSPSYYANICDAYYGEVSYYVPCFTELKKPVMIHDPLV